MEENPVATLGLALGGGGMRGWAHVGVFSVLERFGLRASLVAGCSVGALIGAFYAYGYTLDEMMRFMRAQKTNTLFSLRFDGLGLLSNEALRAYLVQHLGDCRFEDLPIPLHVICTDLETGREVVLSKGPLVDAVLASTAMPGIFAPVEVGGRLLVDGGLCNNVPVSVLTYAGARYTLAVRLHRDVTGLDAPLLRKPLDTPGDVSVATWTERLMRSVRGDYGHLPNGMEVISRAMEIVISQIERFRLQAYAPDILIAPDVTNIGTLSFGEAKEEIYRRGVEAAEEQAPRLEVLARRLARS